MARDDAVSTVTKDLVANSTDPVHTTTLTGKNGRDCVDRLLRSGKGEVPSVVVVDSGFANGGSKHGKDMEGRYLLSLSCWSKDSTGKRFPVFYRYEHDSQYEYV